MTVATKSTAARQFSDEDFHVPAWTQLSALSGRSIRTTLRQGDMVLAFFQPLVFFVCFYVPLRRSLEVPGVDYAQYLLPIIAVFAMFFASMFAGDRAAREVVGGMATRLRSMPVPAWIPVTARTSASLLRSVTALIGALVIGTIFGFRFHSADAAVVFVVVVLAFGGALVIATDALGTVTRNSELSGTVLFGPQLLLVMTSTGFVPAEGFPGWIQPYVRNQPVSQITAALRGLADGRYVSELGVAVAWIVGLLIVGAVLAVRAEGRRA
ncbi:ABC transporter permease [Nocardia spumae]|uniref:ABC transporter permease n=1 Tax=Nocardia spumae TaxID=2887190 RepID=UPI001D145C9A|nr:ABC transporter permease [Nocardia spumae]